ncbi:MAG: hypothetical protein IJ833_08290 [Lachnospiraceae bacterium]|nr:hypothetical protein [Lachnospiraceae bacterium]
MRNKTARVTIVCTFLIVAVVGYYAYLSNKSQSVKAEATMTVVQSTLSRDLTSGYPSTPKEVIKYYNEIMKCFYNEECTDEEIEKLGHKARELYDSELLEANELGTYMIRLKTEITEFRENKRKLTSSSVATSTNVDYYEVDGYSFARIVCGYNFMEGSTNYPTKYVYLLRRDEQKHWKIYGWKDYAAWEELK